MIVEKGDPKGQHQDTLFSHNTIEQIRIYHAAPKNESFNSDGIFAKFTPTQKEALKNIMKEHHVKASTFLVEAMDIYIEIFPLKEKIARHKDVLIDLIDRLP